MLCDGGHAITIHSRICAGLHSMPRSRHHRDTRPSAARWSHRPGPRLWRRRREELADAGLVALFRGVGERCAPAATATDGEAGPQQYESTYFSPVHARLLPNVNSLEEVFDFSVLSTNESRWMPTRSSSVVEVGQVRSLLVPNVPSSLQAGAAACHQDRKVFVIVKAGITMPLPYR